ncbi:MAG: hypothetical protein ACT4OP_13590 [Actinomycetota bacterium]
MSDPLAEARSALGESEAVVERLHKMCSDPERSPRMAAIKDSLLAIRRDLNAGEPESMDLALDRLRDVGGQLGALQVECCAPGRMPLNAEALIRLNKIQLGISRDLGVAHG